MLPEDFLRITAEILPKRSTVNCTVVLASRPTFKSLGGLKLLMIIFLSCSRYTCIRGSMSTEPTGSRLGASSATGKSMSSTGKSSTGSGVGSGGFGSSSTTSGFSLGSGFISGGNRLLTLGLGFGFGGGGCVLGGAGGAGSDTCTISNTGICSGSGFKFT